MAVVVDEKCNLRVRSIGGIQSRRESLIVCNVGLTVSTPSDNCGLTVVFAVETHDSGEYRFVRGKLRPNRERLTVRGLNPNHNHDLKNLFKSAAISASTRPGPLFLFCPGRERDAADDGASHPGTKDRRHYINHLEEGSGVQRQTIESASSLSVSRNEAFPSPTILSGGGWSGSLKASQAGTAGILEFPPERKKTEY